MPHRIPGAALLLLIAISGMAQDHTPANGTTPLSATGALPASDQKIVTKNPEYLKLLAPPQGNDFLQTYSAEYREKSAETDAHVAGISDESLRSQARSEEWVKILNKDRDRFSNEAEAAYDKAKRSFLRSHRDSWFEIGHLTYDEKNKLLWISADSTSPFEASFPAPMDRAAIDRIYNQFHQMAAQEIEQKTREYVSNAGAGSSCARNPDWCYEFGKEEMERNLRSQRIVAVVYGDLENKQIDHLLLVDSETEAVLLELDPHISAFRTASWRFSVGWVPPAPAEPPPAEAQAQPAAPVPAPTKSAPPPDAEKANATGGNAGESASNPPASPDPPPARVRVLGKVTAASILTQTKPQYPPQARAGRIQGDVLLHAIIGKEGKVSEVQVLSGDDSLAQAAVEAVRQWRYKPMLVDGQATEVDTTITVMFSLLE